MIEMENLENPVVPAVNRALNILEFVAKAREPVSIKQVAQSLELPNTTAFRIVKQLSIRGYLEESESQPGCYHLGLQLLTLSNGMTYINNLRQVCHAELDHLAIESHQAVQMGILKGKSRHLHRADPSSKPSADLYYPLCRIAPKYQRRRKSSRRIFFPKYLAPVIEPSTVSKNDFQND